MSETNTPQDEYDQKHGTPKGWEPVENDTGPAAAPKHDKPNPVKHESGGGAE